LKRQSSDHFETPGEKRLRLSVESDSSPPDDFAAIIARAAAAVAQEANQNEISHSQHPEPAPPAPHYTPIVEHGDNVTIFDPHLNMRILSLPILESLVRCFLCSANLQPYKNVSC